MPSYMSPTYTSRRRSSLQQQRSPSPPAASGERSPLSPTSAARVMKAQAAALERTPPRTPASERAGMRLAVHQAISPQDLAAGARASAKRGAQILRLEAEAAAKRAAARELEEVRGALSQRGANTPTASPAQLGSPADSAKAIDDAASAMAAWANNMRSRLADKDDELAQLRAVLDAGRGNAATSSGHAGQAQAYAAAHHAQSLAAQLAAANREIDQLRSALSTSAQRSVHMEARWKAALQEESVRSERTTAEQLEVDNLRQRCETAERMLWLTEEKALADEEAWSEWRTAALKRIELLQDAVDAHERSPSQQQLPGGGPGARVHWAEQRPSNSNLDANTNSDDGKTRRATAPGAASWPSGQDWPWDGEDGEDDDEDDSDDIGDRGDEMWSFSGKSAGSAVGGTEQIEALRREQQVHVNLQRVNEQKGGDEDDDEHDEDDDDDEEEVDSNAIWKLRDELTVLNAKVKGLEDELEDELEGSEDQASTQETSEESDERGRQSSNGLFEDGPEAEMSVGTDESWMFKPLATHGRSRRQPHQSAMFERADHRRRSSENTRRHSRRSGTGTNTSPHDLNAETETETERSLHEELAHGEAQGDLHSKLMLLVAVLVLVLAMAVTPLELVLALGSDILSAVGGVLRGSRYLVGTLSDTIRTLCGWAVLGTSKIVQAIADAVQ